MNKMAVANELVAVAKSLSAGPRDVVKTWNVKIDVVDFLDDVEEPAYDVNVSVDGKHVDGGQFTTEMGTERALRNATAFAEKLIRDLVRTTGETLRG